MGGKLSEEFQAITDIGEDVLVLCDKCDYSSNLEISQNVCKEKDICFCTAPYPGTTCLSSISSDCPCRDPL